MMILGPLLYILVCVIVSYVGRRQRFGFWGYFFCSLLVTPAIGLLMVIAAGGAGRAKAQGSQ